MSIPPGTSPVVRRLLYAWLGTAFLLLVAILVLLYCATGGANDGRGIHPSATAMPTATQAPTSTPTILATASLPALLLPPHLPRPLPPQPPQQPARAGSLPCRQRLRLRACRRRPPPRPPRSLPQPSPRRWPERGVWSRRTRSTCAMVPALIAAWSSGWSVGESFIPLARSEDANWLQIVTYDGIQGWVSRMGVFCARGELDNLPVVATPEETPTPVPTATPVVITEWRGAYYNNTALAGPRWSCGTTVRSALTGAPALLIHGCLGTTLACAGPRDGL